MHAVYPRARVRLSALAVAVSLSSSLAVGITGAPAHAAAPTSTPSGTLTSNDAVTTPAPAALSLAALIAPQAIKKAPTKHVSAKKPVQIAAAHQKAVAHKLAVKKAAAKKAAAKKAAVKKAAKRAAAHRVAVAKAAAAARRAAFGTRIIRAASRYLGTPYRYGATGPTRFDCSGFTRFIFAKFGISLPHSSSGQYSMVQHIPSSQKRIGDLVFFHSSGGHVYHVGIYAGGDEIWAATHTGDFVRLEGMWNASYYVGRIT